jgi:RNA polymerase sigma-70 factor, ECF subfamily
MGQSKKVSLGVGNQENVRRVAADVLESSSEALTDARDRATAPDRLGWDEFELVVMPHHTSLRLFAHRLISDPDLADDALQEAYLKVFRALSAPGRRRPNQQRRWLFKVVYHSCIDQIRRGLRTRETCSPPIDHVDAAPALDTAVLRRVEILEALAGLPPDLRAALVLVDGLGFSYDAAAEVIGVRRGTVASRLHAARTRLRATLEEDDSND